MRRDGRVVDGGGLENHCRGNSTGGSNPSPSANLRRTLASVGKPASAVDQAQVVHHSAQLDGGRPPVQKSSQAPVLASRAA